MSGKNQSSYTKHLLQFIDQYVEETGEHTIDMRMVAAWAINNGLWEPQPEDKVKRLARDLSRAARQDYVPDDDGLPVRRLHSYKIKQEDVQLTFWVNMEDATREQMRNATQWRRNGVLADCIQLDPKQACPPSPAGLPARARGDGTSPSPPGRWLLGTLE
jgi:hypothetical protein